MRTRVTIGDESWVFDEADLDLNDAFMLKSGTGLGLKSFFEGVADMDPEAIRGLVWFLRRKAGEQITPEAVNFKLSDLDIEQEADPTEGDATPSESDATA